MGPTNLERVDLTPCFENTILFGLPSLIAIIAFTIRGYCLLSKKKLYASKEGRANNQILYAASMTCLTVACAALITRLVQLNQGSSSPATIFGGVTLLVSWILALGLNYLELGYKFRSSTYLFAFYAVNIIASLIYIRTLHDTGLSGGGQFVSFCVFFGASVVAFIVETWPRRQYPQQDNKDGKNERLTPYEKANLCSRLCFYYMQDMFSTGFRRPLLDEDIADQMPQHLKTQHSFTHLSHKWEEHRQKRRAKGKTPNLMLLSLRAVGSRLVPVTLISLAQSVLEYSQVLLLAVLLDYITTSTSAEEEARPPIKYGIILAVALFLSTVLATLASGQFFQQSYVLGIELRTSLIGLIYQKSLVLSPGARQRSTVGEISNHMSVDTERIGFGITAFPMIVSSTFEIVLAIYLLYNRLGASSLTSVGVIIMILPMQGLMAKVVNKAKDRKLGAMDSRIQILTEVLSSIKTVKMYSWENAFRERVARFRATEIKYLRNIGVASAFMCIMFSSLPLVMSLLTFVIYSYFGGPGGTRGTISAEMIFVTVTLFARLSQPLGRISGMTSSVIALRVAFKRIQGLLVEEELDLEQIEYRDKDGSGGSDEKVALEIRDGVFAWTSVRDEQLKKEKSEKEAEKKKKTKDTTTMESSSSSKKSSPTSTLQEAPTIDSIITISSSDAAPPLPQDTITEPLPILTNINLTVPQGSLTAVVGRVGQGKSSLMSALIGEMYKCHGQVIVSGSVAYVSQVAWILNGSLRDNILFGSTFNQSKYDRIIESAGLLPDIRILPAGDATEIGERGINLSGGQKQRVALARAAYQDADVYLLDDPLSAVDAHVDQHLWDRLVGPGGLLKDKTRVLITHGIHHLNETDQILVMKAGEVAETGTYEDLMAAGKDFYQLITDYAVQEKKQEIEETEKVLMVGEIGAVVAGSKGEEGLKAGVDAAVPEAAVKATAAATTNNMGEDDAQLVLAEEDAQSKVGWPLLKAYFKSASYLYSFLSFFIYILSQSSQIGVNIWLQHWSSRSEASQRDGVPLFLGVYAILVLSYMASDISVNLIIFVAAGIRSSRLLHDRLADKVLRLPMSFFDTTPFSTDMDNLDSELPNNVTDVYYFLSIVLGTIIVISFNLPVFIALIPFLLFFYFWIQIYYMRTSRALKRIHMISKSPLFQHFSETLAGVSTIRAMRCHARFSDDNARKSDRSANAYWAYITANRWLSVRLEFLGGVVVLATALLCVWKMDELGTGGAGLALSYSLTVTFHITYLVTSLSNLQNQLVSVDRILEYCEKKPEAPLTIEEMEVEKLPVARDFRSALDESAGEGGQWKEGSIEFKNYSTRYREGMELVIKNLSVRMEGGEKVGIVGRTGAGKSSLTLALFRLAEAANSHFAKASYNTPDCDVAAATLLTKASPPGNTEKLALQDLASVEVEESGGSIEIDGIDISTIGLHDLRHRIAIIPQDPTLFAGTLRENLDPFSEQNDADLWTALERAHLKPHISSLSGGLSHEVSQGGENFSVGQRSLICLARALLRKTKILILDEATAAVDMETDELIQKTIRKEFKDRTILTIAHRIKTVMDSDKILVLDQGRMKEFAAPGELLERRESLFYQLAEQAGEIGDHLEGEKK
ncbi:hypothetical protein KI688_004624 [Linnemannia hyalina]|uniref:P-loop containing nucleoside triphosphate hydrolase protein n=1 Tax=Linnemannia hyalina TaxID=64524 RepID=A0A9P8BNP8_9FUNG|nr:hypothetical protein KI688_004624 [Linnemannia hyalina]